MTIAAGDDEGRERLCRYVVRHALSMARMSWTKDGRIAYQVKYARSPTRTHLLLEPMQFMARLAALIPAPRHPLVRYVGVLSSARYFGQDEEMLAVDRVVANTHEQMVPFVVSLWLFAIFASPTHATWLGAAYVVLRGAYPFLLGKRVSKLQSKRVALVTFPCYAIVFTLLGGAAWAALSA